MRIPASSFWRKLAAYSGPGYLVAVGYMDPGNWATGIAGGSAFGFRLLCVIVLANLLAMFLQRLAAKLGIVTGLDLAQACRARYSAPTRIFLWLVCEAAIVACDLAELIGAAIALKLLFGIDLVVGVALTGIEVLLVLALQRRGFRLLEAIIVSLMIVIGGCFAVELALAQPRPGDVLQGLVPGAISLPPLRALPRHWHPRRDCDAPQSLPALLDRADARLRAQRSRNAGGYTVLDDRRRGGAPLASSSMRRSSFSRPPTFHAGGMKEGVGIEEAHRLLAPALGVGAASTVFAVALLASGHNSAITGTMAGQIVMEGFTRFRWPGWARRLIGRLIAMVPAMFAVTLYGEDGATRLLIFSQVVLSLQLPFAVIPWCASPTAGPGWGPSSIGAALPSSPGALRQG